VGEHVTLQVDDQVATIRIDRPPMNAIDLQVMEGLRETAAQVGERDDVGAVVLYGGERVFAAGADVKMLAGLGPEQVREMITAMQEAYDVVEAIPRVVIAAINGYALGGGCELALCADFRFAAREARLGQPEILLGLIPGAGGTQRLPRLVGPARAKDLIYSGRQIDADEALRIGLVDGVFPAGEAYSGAVEAARRFAKGPRDALRAAKTAVDGGLRTDLGTGLLRERELFAELFGTADQEEGIAAFLEKRAPRFGGGPKGE
jgi:enoyl-CoA hydratase/carnithine racemase